ncbi:cutinase family protein [Kineosporia babensis]|uniref:Cutinase family protein n=1 Tax=Kineosporia babensis TaxID=499548 RepID=A0A9X1NHE0_9ACTN|nr:cutinase family protein [Kineosporia babensis]
MPPRWIACSALVALLVTGCSGDEETPDRPTTTYDAACTEVLVVTVRGTGEPLDETNLLSPVAAQISQEHAVRHYDVPYPANAQSLSTTPGDAYFGESADEGVRLVVQELNAAARACPDQRSVVMGFSQGALVVGDALISPSERDAGQEAGELTPKAKDDVVASVLYGDPRFVGSEPFNAGTYDSSLNGMMTNQRRAGALDEFADRLRSYCVANDFVCQAGGQFDPHVSYFNNGMRQQGAEFALGKF